MKALKKTLCLVLALVMAFGLLGISASAADKVTYYGNFKDASTITYTEAVDVMVQLGIIEGRDTGYFDGSATVNRAEAAKIMSYLLLGQKEADALVASTKPFNDVEKNAWYAGYVSFCVKEGIIDGYGDGKFGPADPVTAYQFGKMLLKAVGYGAQGEFVGDFWYVAVYKLCISKGIFSIAGIDYNKGADREEATVYAFNALASIPQVQYIAALKDYVYKDDLRTGIASSDEIGEASEYTLGEEYYDLDCIYGQADWATPTTRAGMYIAYNSGSLYAPAGNTDVFDSGRYGHIWAVNSYSSRVGKTVSDCYFDDTLVTTTYDYATYAAAPKAPTLSESWYNGDGDNYESNYDRGVKVEIYAYGAGYYALGFEQEVCVASNKIFTGDVTIGGVKYDAIRIPGVTDGFEPKANWVGYENIKKGDVVLVTEMDNDVNYCAIATSVTGAKTTCEYDAVTGAITSITFAGKAYLDSEQYGTYTGALFTSRPESYNVQYVAYLDQGGYICFATPVAAVSDLAIYVGSGYAYDSLKDVWTYESTFVGTDAKVYTVTTDKYFGTADLTTVGSVTAGAYGYTRYAPVDEFVTLSKTAAGLTTIDLTWDAGQCKGALITKGAAKIADSFYGNDYYGNEDTVYIIRTTAKDGTKTYAAYTGYQNIPDAYVLDVVATPAANGNMIAAYVYADVTYLGDTAEFLVLSTQPVRTVHDAALGTYHVIPVWMNGTTAYINVRDINDFEDGCYYKFSRTSNATVDAGGSPVTNIVSGVINDAEDAYEPEATTTINLLGTGVALVGGVEKHTTASTVVYRYVGSEKAVKAYTLPAAMDNEDIWNNETPVYVTYNADGTIKEIYTGLTPVEKY